MSKADHSNTEVSHSSTEASHHSRPAWNPGNGDESRLIACQNENCGNKHLDPKFARIFGGEDGTVFACPECTSWASLRQGAAANPTFIPRVRFDGRGLHR
ncbi:DUF7563 family protein [Haladaptatus cibarius]|uniref:DUF7563 family protein n=1 Tax=Haladaptatus cibarius TaxID=453847 RepID=UPI00067887F8|nr:hypothetical protein [Haladaptatus cibarius]